MIYLITSDNDMNYEDREQYNVCYFTNREDAEQWLRENAARRDAYVQYYNNINQMIANIVPLDEPMPERPRPTSSKMSKTELLAYAPRKAEYERAVREIHQRAAAHRQKQMLEIRTAAGEPPQYYHNAKIEQIELGSLNNTCGCTH